MSAPIGAGAVIREHDVAATAPVSFRRNDRAREKKTDSWEVWSLRDARHVGRVRWQSQRRRYCFFASAGSALDRDCLIAIGEFIESETAKHRKGKRAFGEPAE